MLPFTLPEIDENVLRQICSEQWSETQTLEFKALLPGNDEDAKHEFRKDVCAMANAEGGDLIYGISEKSGRANAILPIPGLDFDAVKRRLKQILESKVEPRIHNIRIHHCLLANGGFVLILRIPSSYDGPHRFGPPTEHRFAIRTDTSTSDMTYDQLRNAFGRSETLHQQAAQFRSERVEKIASGHTPRRLGKGVHLAVHIIPMCSLAGRVKVDVAALQADHETFRLDPSYAWLRVANLAGLVIYPYDDENGIDTYMQVFRNGIFEAVSNVELPNRSDGNLVGVNGPIVARELRNSLTVYATQAKKIGVEGPAVVSISLTNTEGTLLAMNEQTASKRPILDSRLEIPEIMVDDLAAGLKLDEITRPILDVLYQCYGRAQCNLFDQNGVWRQRG